VSTRNLRMGPLSAILVAALLVATSDVSGAHELGARVDLPSKFERFVVPAGSVRVLEYYSLGQLDGPGGVVRLRVARVSAAGQTIALIALEVRVSGPSAARATHTGFIDSDDLDSLIRALGEMDRMLKKRYLLSSAETAEAEFSAGSVRVGTVLTNRPGDRDRLYIVAGNPSRATATLDPRDLPKVRALVSTALEKIGDLAAGKTGDR